MLWSGSSPLTVIRDGMWGLLLFAGVTWLALAWSVLRLEPAGLANVAGPIILFGAVTEAVRALAGSRTWWLNAGMAVLFAATGLLLLSNGDSTWATPAALIGWYLMVRGAADIAISMLTREADRIWGLLMVVGVLEAGLGFFSASSFVRTPELVVLVLGGAALTRGVADLVASLRLREVTAVARAGRLLELTPERAVGVAGYSAGLADFEARPRRSAGARHRAAPRSLTAALRDLPATGSAPVRAHAQLPQEHRWPAAARSELTAAPERGVPNTAPSFSGLSARFEQIGLTASPEHSSPTPSHEHSGPTPSPEHSSLTASLGYGGLTADDALDGPAGGRGGPAGGHGGPAEGHSGPAGGHGGPAGGHGGPAGAQAPGETAILPAYSLGEHGAPSASFHDEVLRTTADLDAMLALAGVSGAAAPGVAAWTAADGYVEVPDTAEGAAVPPAETDAAQRRAPEPDDGSLPLLDVAARTSDAAGMDDTIIITRRLVD